MKGTLTGLLSLSCILLVSSHSKAAIIHVPADYPTIQAGIDAAFESDTVLVADGVYSGEGNREISLRGKPIHLVSANGPSSCIIDAERHTQCIIFNSGETHDTVLEGFSLTNGYGRTGGGISCSASSPLILNCIITGNTADGGLDHAGYGGGISCSDSSLTVKDSSIISNRCYGYDGASGGGLYVNNSVLTIDNCLIANNEMDIGTRGGTGGGISGIDSDLTVCNTTISDNIAIRGSGLYLSAISTHSATISNCRMVSNYCEGFEDSFYGGSAMKTDGFNLTIVNCLISSNSGAGGAFSQIGSGNMDIINTTFAENTAGLEGSAIDLWDVSTATMTNCVLWGNTADPIKVYGGASLTIGYSCIQGGYTGQDNIAQDPMFVQIAEGCYFLSQTSSGQASNSPCVDSGSDVSSNICFALTTGQSCLDEYSTRTDLASDWGTVDMGYHYGDQPLPNLTKNGLELVMKDIRLQTGDSFDLSYYLYNPTEAVRHNDIWVLLDVEGYYWFYPGWGTDPEAETNVLNNPLSIASKPILTFKWPDVAGAATGLRFWGAAFDAGTFNPVGEIQMIEFGYD